MVVLLAMPAALPQAIECCGQKLLWKHALIILAMSSSTATCLETVFLDCKGGHLMQHCLDEYQELVIVPAGQLSSLRNWQPPPTGIHQSQ